MLYIVWVKFKRVDKMRMQVLVVIPSRLAAARLPNKPLADICGKPMIVRVWEKATQANIGPVIVACGDQEILDALKAYGAEGVMTDPHLPSGTDRVKAAADVYDPTGKYQIVVNVQGDLPTMDPAFVHHIMDPFKNTGVDISTLAVPIEGPHELADLNKVKIALSLQRGEDIGRALYFSRHPVPSGEGPDYHHIGIYGFKREALNRFVTLPVDPLEAREKLEQIRALADGMRIDVKVVNTSSPFGVDTPADLERAIRIVAAESA